MDELLGRIGSIDIQLIIDNAIEEEKDFLLDLIRSQLLKGDRADGSAIGYYSKNSEKYIDKKYDLGLFQGGSEPKYDLYFSGDFYRSLIAHTLGDDIEIESTDSKLEDIMDNTGDLDNALTLNEDNLELFRQRILPIIQNKINGHLGI